MAVSQCGCSFFSVSCKNAPGVACAHSHQRGRLVHRHMLRQQAVEDLKSCLLLLVQCHILHEVTVTFMLSYNTYPVHFAAAVYTLMG